MSLINRKTVVSSKYSAGTNNYLQFVGKQGITTTKLAPNGNAKIQGQEIPVIGDKFMEAGVFVTVSRAEGNTVFVSEFISGLTKKEQKKANKRRS